MLTDPIPLSKLRRVLVIKLGHHGDVLLASPVLSVLRQHVPQLEIDALIYADTIEMFNLHPALSQIHTIDRSWKQQNWLARLGHEWNLLRTLRSRSYDLIIALDHNWRAWRLVRLCRPTWSVAPAGSSRRWRKAFTHLVAKPRGGYRHVVESGLDALRRIGIQPELNQRQLVLVTSAADQQRSQELLAGLDLLPQQFIHIHPASRWRFKCWPAEHFAELIKRLQEAGWPVLLTAANNLAEATMIAEIQKKLAQPAASLAGQLSLKELAAISQQAKLFIGVDSAPMHIAAAQQTPVIALFGPSGEGHWAPWMVKAKVINNPNWTCRPCGIDGCGGGKIAECLTTLPVDAVWDACTEMLRAA